MHQLLRLVARALVFPASLRLWRGKHEYAVCAELSALYLQQLSKARASAAFL